MNGMPSNQRITPCPMVPSLFHRFTISTTGTCYGILIQYGKKHCRGLVTIAQYEKPEERIVTCKRVFHLSEEAPMVSIPKIVGVLSCA